MNQELPQDPVPLLSPSTPGASEGGQFSAELISAAPSAASEGGQLLSELAGEVEISGRLDRNPAAVYLGLLGPGSRRVQLSGLCLALRTLSGGTVSISGDRDHREAAVAAFPWSQLRYQHTAALRRRLLDEGYRPATINRVLCAVRGVLREAWKLGQMNSEDYSRSRNVESIRSTPLPAGRALSTGEIRGLMEACATDPRPAGVRDAALISLLYGCGLRRLEAVHVNLDDFDPEEGSIAVRVAKLDGQRLVFLPEGGRRAIASWLGVRGISPGALLCPVRQTGEVEIRRITPQSVYYALKRRAKQAGISKVSPHDLRRSFVTHLLDAGADVLSVQRLAGHKDSKTTMRYDRRGEQAKRSAAQLLHVPFAEGRSATAAGVI